MLNGININNERDSVFEIGISLGFIKLNIFKINSLPSIRINLIEIDNIISIKKEEVKE